MNELDEKLFEDYEIKQEITNIEKDLVNTTVDNLTDKLEIKKMELCSKVENFIEEYMVEDDKGKLKLNVKGSPALVISEYFFKPIIPVVGLEPRYNCEKMSIVFELYRELVSQINTKIGKFIPNKTHFCRFAGITTMTYNNYLKCSDENLQTIMNMIDDYMLDANLTSSQNREVDNVTTIFRAKVEQNKQEQPAQQTVVIADNVDLNLIQERIRKLNRIKRSESN